MTIIQCPKAPWYTDDIRVQKTIRRNFERCWCRSGLATDRQSYADQCLLVENLIFKAKMNYYSDLINDAGADNNALFRSIDRLLRRKPEKRFPSCSSSKELSNKNKDKIINIRSQLGTPELPDHFRLLDIPTLNCQLDIFSITSTQELSKIICQITCKSCCFDPLPATLVVNQLDILLPVICRIVNLSFECGCLPSSLKIAALLPLLKKSSLNHEVFNLKVVSKIIEKVVAVRLNHYLELNHLNEPLQSAYKRFHWLPIAERIKFKIL